MPDEPTPRGSARLRERDRDMLNDVLDALDRLMNMFRAERNVHMIAAGIGFLLLIYAVAMLITQGKADTATVVSLFGAGGVIAFSSARISFFLNKAFKLFEDIVREMVIRK
jgi:predicted membrane channel-forming protein YqfA (hemolysin III family)